MHAHNFRDLTGLRFNRRLVLSFAGIKTFRSPRAKQSFWLTRCDCGTEAEVSAGSLHRGRSCGCLSREISGVSRRLPNGGAARNANLLKYKSSSAKRSINWGLSEEQFDSLTSGNCYYCGVEPRQICKASRNSKQIQQVIYNGIDRVNNFRGYETDNVVSCCKICNRAKDVMSKEEFISWARRVVSHSGAADVSYT